MTAFVRKRGEKQVFQPVQPARGKTVAAGADTTFQMDLADLKNSPEVRESATYKFLPRGSERVRPLHLRPQFKDQGA